MKRLLECNPQTLPANWAEWLLKLGKRVNCELRRGVGIQEVSRLVESNTDTCKLGFVFYKSCDLVKLRAMVEDWSRDRLVTELGGMFRQASTRQIAGTR